jgi:hypothetical protein
MGEADATFQYTRKVVLSLTSPSPLPYATTLKKITIHLMFDPITPRLLRIYRVPKPPLEEGEVLPPKPTPHTRADLHHTDQPRTPVSYTTWACNGLPSQKKSSFTRHNHIAGRLIFCLGDPPRTRLKPFQGLG